MKRINYESILDSTYENNHYKGFSNPNTFGPPAHISSILDDLLSGGDTKMFRAFELFYTTLENAHDLGLSNLTSTDRYEKN